MMNIIEEIFIDFMEQNEVQDSTKVKRANKRVINYLGDVANVNKADVEDMLTGLGYEYEKQGFINGFKYALSLKKGGATHEQISC